MSFFDYVNFFQIHFWSNSWTIFKFFFLFFYKRANYFQMKNILKIHELLFQNRWFFFQIYGYFLWNPLSFFQLRELFSYFQNQRFSFQNRCFFKIHELFLNPWTFTSLRTFCQIHDFLSLLTCFKPTNNFQNHDWNSWTFFKFTIFLNPLTFWSLWTLFKIHELFLNPAYFFELVKF